MHHDLTGEREEAADFRDGLEDGGLESPPSITMM